MDSLSKKKSSKTADKTSDKSTAAGKTGAAQSIIGPLNIVGDRDIQGGYLELGPNLPEGETPFIDFHLGNVSGEDFNARLINSQNRRLDFIATEVMSSSLRVSEVANLDGSLNVNGATELKANTHVAGNLRVDKSALFTGNVGIGRTAPVAKLDIGNVRTDENGLGKNLWLRLGDGGEPYSSLVKRTPFCGRRRSGFK
jgi:hypothetical protein